MVGVGLSVAVGVGTGLAVGVGTELGTVVAGAVCVGAETAGDEVHAAAKRISTMAQKRVLIAIRLYRCPSYCQIKFRLL